EDGIRDFHVTGVQTCALPISPFGREPIPVLEELSRRLGFEFQSFAFPSPGTEQSATWAQVRRFRPDWVLLWSAGPSQSVGVRERSEERRGGKEWRCGAAQGER